MKSDTNEAMAGQELDEESLSSVRGGSDPLPLPLPQGLSDYYSRLEEARRKAMNAAGYYYLPGHQSPPTGDRTPTSLLISAEGLPSPSAVVNSR
ncbi:MAG: hypothetical protein RL033_3742 [Pseudomonadota bacterium]